MKYVFIFGKNPDLSLAELVCYLQPKKFKIIEHNKQFSVVETDIDKNTINELGGTIKIAEVFQDFSFIEEMPEKFDLGVTFYGCKGDAKEIKNKIKSYDKNPGLIKSKLTHTYMTKTKFLENGLEILICQGKEKYFAKTVFVHNPFDFKKRDTERPKQRAIYSISPRLSKIMINLSKSKGTILDPFCGIGTILQEALLMGFDVKGLDINPKCIEDCKENLKWLENKYNIKNKYELKQGDSRKLSMYFKKTDAIVSEPYLGKPLKSKPSFNQAIKIINELTPLYKSVLKESMKLLNKGDRIVIITPCFFTEKGRVGMDIERIAGKKIDPLKKYGIKHSFPLLDYEKRHKTIREINVIEK